jgi:hypothetical protein
VISAKREAEKHSDDGKYNENDANPKELAATLGQSGSIRELKLPVCRWNALTVGPTACGELSNAERHATSQAEAQRKENKGGVLTHRETCGHLTP